MGGVRQTSGDRMADRETPRTDEARPSESGPGSGEGDRSPDEQAEIDREAGDVADDLADFA